MNFDFSKEPGKELKKREYEGNIEPLISIITPFYNSGKYIEQTVNSVLNQTFPAFELLIIDDGSKDKESLERLKKIEKIDKRIKVFHKQNEGLAATRDYGAKKASKSSKYLCFLDDDDLIDPTYLECLYFAMETNKKASWAYTDSVGFEGQEYTWNKYFDSNKMKKQNDIVATALIRKEDFEDVNGYELREKAVNEDWNFWLKLLAKEKFPVHVSTYGFWYRRKLKGSELSRVKENQKRNMEIISNAAKAVKKKVKAIQYPRFDYNWDLLADEIKEIPKIKIKDDKKIHILMIIPWMVMGGADQFNFDLISRIDKSKFDITIVTTEPAINIYRQKFEEYATVYDLTTFLNQKYWLAFINYIIYKNNINIILNTNSELGYSILPYLKAKHPQIPIIDYIHMEEWYNRNGGYSRDSSAVASVIDKTLVCNENSRKILIDYFKRKENEVKTVYIGVDEKNFNPEKINKEELKEKYNLPDNKYIISYICRISDQKRPFLLLEIVKHLKQVRNDFIVLVVGDGNLLSKMKSVAKKENLQSNIIFLGRTNKTKEIYAISDLTINCSIKEGLALTAYESLSMGVPVVSSDVGGQKELIDSKTGIVVPCMQDEKNITDCNYKIEEIQNYVDAVDEVLSHLKKYKQNCRKKILNGFTIDQMVDKMTKILEDTVKNPNKNKNASANNIDIYKELITNRLISIKEKYLWEVKEYNNYFGYIGDELEDYRFEIFKDKMWQHKWYRGIIRFLQKIGVMQVFKKMREKNI